jgi:hypothetical protein
VPPHARDFEVTKRRTEIIDGDMTPADILGTLEGLDFSRGNYQRAVIIDQHVRDFLVTALRARKT